ncbi:cytochrome d ubiquinol oxidase subunit I [Melghirimyces profundicolus]|uniref:Cytochrome d ubiquinol oxidase subunit I n=1 Tax=Melghirimyces profundicolus TaxID=1242148 RepID=A0A2T6C4R4_9BACL|nr:cytochrome ubiquinol oxidase subunit I [Melghirimyces profundicolus]PTX63304.1 cytochrome d ubiquinol oxidase subunit I [Melghirimyces profundicolus]
MDELTIARSLFGSSLAFHIIFATLGVGLPFMILVSEIVYQITRDRDYTVMAKRWTKAQAILLGVAIPSGTIVAVQLSLLWPKFMEVVGEVIALPFQIELFAFFLEALFMSIYVYAADRLSPITRIVSVFLVALGGSASAVLITSANAWMNTPTGFKASGGKITEVHPLNAFFNPSFPSAALHVLASAYMTGAFAIAGLAAWRMLHRKSEDREYGYHKKALMMSLAVGGLMSLATAWNGHAAGQVLYDYQPEKLAAAEGHFETRAYAPLALGGIVDPDKGELVGAIKIPWALSFLADNRFDAVVKGLNDFPRENWPPFYVHTLFNLMVVIGVLLIFLSFLAWILQWRRRGKKKTSLPRWLLGTLAPSGLLSMLGIEFGWVFTCSGRQPWTVYHYQRTSEAVTDAAGLGLWFVVFIGLYLLLLVGTVIVMHSFFGRHPLREELEGIQQEYPAEGEW